MKCPLLLALMPLAMLLALPIAAQGQSQPAYLDSVVDIQIEGNRSLSNAAVLAYVKTRPGQPYNEQVVRDDEQRLLKTRRFDNVVATKTQTDKGVIVTFTLTERPVIEEIRFEGNKQVKTADLQALLLFGVKDPIDQFQIENAARSIETKYKGDGYYFVQVTVDERALRDARQLVFRIVEGPRAIVRKIRFEGNTVFPDLKLSGEINSKERFWPFIPGTLDMDTVDRDVVDLRNFYRNEGYLDAQVARELTFSADKRSVTLTFLIEQGARYRIRAIVFEGVGTYPHEDMRRQLSLQPGSYYNALKLQRDAEKVRDTYGEIGFIDAEAVARTRYAAPTDPAPDWYRPEPNEKPALVDLLYTVREGSQYRLGQVAIRGNAVTKMNVIRRQLQFEPGQLYNMVAVKESEKRLSESQLFEKVTITPYGDMPGVRDALVQVQEGKTGRFMVGVGVSSNSGLMGNVTYTENNFDLFAWPRSGDWGKGRAFRGAGQTFTISIEPGMESSRARIDWYEPFLNDKPYSLGTSLYAFTSQRETYQETRVGANAALGHRFKNRWYGEIAVRAEDVIINKLDDDAPPDVHKAEGGNFIVGVKGTLVRDTTDSRWLPTTGDRLSLSLEEVVGSWNFAKAIVDYHRYFTVHRDALDRPHILAFRGTVGDVFGGDSPVFERFYGGGLGSIRGFKYRGVSPRQDHEVVGGDFMTFLGSEYSYPIIGQVLRGVFFIDSGTVERTASVSDYRVSAGFGFRVHVPFFGPVPITLDFGLPVKKADDDDTQLVSFSFGWVF